jgi:hypothetical protein
MQSTLCRRQPEGGPPSRSGTAAADKKSASDAQADAPIRRRATREGDLCKVHTVDLPYEHVRRGFPPRAAHRHHCLATHTCALHLPTACCAIHHPNNFVCLLLAVATIGAIYIPICIMFLAMRWLIHHHDPSRAYESNQWLWLSVVILGTVVQRSTFAFSLHPFLTVDEARAAPQPRTAAVQS